MMLGSFAGPGGILNLLIASGDDEPDIVGASMFFLNHPVVGGHQWEAPVVDDTCQLIVLVTFTDGATSLVLVP